MMRAALSISAMVFLGALIGCTEDTTTQITPIAISDFPCEATTAGSWASTTFPPVAAGCEWISYKGQTTYEIEHGLGAAPTLISAYIAFEESGVGATIASGDAFTIRAVDDTFVTIRNTTKQDFFLRLELR